MVIDVSKNELVPKHILMEGAEKKALLEKYQISLKELPKILLSDPAIAKLNAKAGDVVKIERRSQTAGQSFYYRQVMGD